MKFLGTSNFSVISLRGLTGVVRITPELPAFMLLSVKHSPYIQALGSLWKGLPHKVVF